MILSFNIEENEEEYDDDLDIVYVFSLKNEDNNTIANFECNTFGIDSNSWAMLHQAICESSEYTITFEEINGAIKIYTKNGYVYFSIGRYGGNVGGNINFKVENIYCENAIREALEYTLRMESKLISKDDDIASDPNDIF